MKYEKICEIVDSPSLSFSLSSFLLFLLEDLLWEDCEAPVCPALPEPPPENDEEEELASTLLPHRAQESSCKSTGETPSSTRKLTWSRKYNTARQRRETDDRRGKKDNNINMTGLKSLFPVAILIWNNLQSSFMQNFCQLIVLWVAISAQAFRCSICTKKVRISSILTAADTITEPRNRITWLEQMETMEYMLRVCGLTKIWKWSNEYEKNIIYRRYKAYKRSSVWVVTVRRTLTRLMSVSYCRAEPDVAVTTPALRKMPCSSRSFLILRTWESRVCRSRSWRYFSFEPQINSNSFLTCLLTNGVCWIIRYWQKRKTKLRGCVHVYCVDRGWKGK